jgi:hypothetical protein
VLRKDGSVPGDKAPWTRPLISFGSFGLLLVRFMLPVPVGQADDRDGPRLMCGAGFRLGPAYPAHYPRFFRYAYFQYQRSPECRLIGRPYPTSEAVPMELARGLTRLLGLPGTINLLALGLIFCLVAATGITALATGLRVRPWAQIVIAAALWLIIADAAFFDVFASPYEEPAALTGLLLFAAGLLYLGRGWRSTLAGLALAGPGGIGVAVSKEQYLILALPVCATLILASAPRGTRGWRRYLTRQTYAATAVAALIALLAGAYSVWDTESSAAQRLHRIQAVDTIFVDIVNAHDTTRAADLRDLHLPVSWAKYAGKYFWAPGSVRRDPLFRRYAPELTLSNLAHFELTHPADLLRIGNDAANEADMGRIVTLGDYPPYSGHPPGAIESRVIVVTWLLQHLSRHLGLAWLLPLWGALLAVGITALRRRRAPAWHHDGAVLVLSMTTCAVLAFIPPGFFESLSVTRHMVVENLATDLAVTVAIALAASMIWRAATTRRGGAGSAGEQPDGVLPRPRRDEPDVVDEPPALAGQQELAGVRQGGDAVEDRLGVAADPLPGGRGVHDVGDLAAAGVDPGQERPPDQVGPDPAV